MGSNSAVLAEKEVIGGQRRRARCLKCGSTDRERLMFAYLGNERDFLTKGHDKKILHIAPESNLNSKFRSASLPGYVCGDKFTFGYNYPEYVKHIDILDLSFPENHFDLIICNHVLEHIPDDNLAIKELFRVLKPEGEAILQVPISANTKYTVEDHTIMSDEKRKELFGQEDHMRIYGQDYTDRLSHVGFKVTRVNISKKYNLYGLNQQEDIFIATKGSKTPNP
ncbi:class I SAM-dependent methyltransferase [Pedobacter lusitanus]|nr:class I SAM-dependent methyltransferase [Pedobacter lusitanus]